MRKLKVTICLCLVVLFLATGTSLGVGAPSAPNGNKFVPGELIVGLEAITADTIEALETRGGRIIKEISALNALVVKVTVGNENKYIQSVRSIPGVKYSEQNGIVQAVYTPNDPYWDSLWNMRVIEADDAWNIHKGSTSVVIAILDTGVDYNHQDLSAHYVSGGYDWVNDDNDPWDDQYHGTHCAGIAAAVMDNNVGVVGVAQAGIWAEKVLDETGSGDWVDLAYGIWHATVGGVDIISMSLGGDGYSSIVDDACSYAWSNGVLLVAAAGNDGRNIDIYPHYPASYETVIAVSATTSSDLRWSGSNYGNTIELAAPGATVYSTIPGNGYIYLTGTSMACPHVAGVAAITWSYSPSLTNAQVRQHLHTAVDDLGAPGKDIYYGYGRINAYQALTGGEEFQYHFRLNPYMDVFHMNTNPGGWLNGIVETPSYTVPLIGKYEEGMAYIVWDLTPGEVEVGFVALTIATKDGYIMRIRDDLSIIGPEYVWLTPVTATAQSMEGPTLDEAIYPQATPQAWHDFQTNPHVGVVHLSTDHAPWLKGWTDAVAPGYPAPVLGYYSGDKFYFAMDYIDDTGIYELSFWAGRIGTKDGYAIGTTDGTTYVGPNYFWLTTP